MSASMIGAKEWGRTSRHRIATDWLEPAMAGDRRWTPRSSINSRAAFRLRWQRRFGVQVENFSTHGCRIAHGGCLIKGTYAWITFPTLESWYARVAWCDGGAAGLDFADPLHKSVADMIVTRTIMAQRLR